MRSRREAVYTVLTIVALCSIMSYSEGTNHTRSSRTSHGIINTEITEEHIIGNTAEELADAIYWAEGGSGTRFLYGIRSVRCDNDRECRAVCINTIRNNVRRFREDSEGFDNYLEFLAHRYAPIGVENDPGDLNRDWLRNVRYYLTNPKKVQGDSL